MLIDINLWRQSGNAVAIFFRPNGVLIKRIRFLHQRCENEIGDEDDGGKKTKKSTKKEERYEKGSERKKARDI